MKKPQKALGKGLHALFNMQVGDNQEDENQSEQNQNQLAPVGFNTSQASAIALAAQPPGAGGALIVDIRKVEPNPDQPRQYFDEEALAELAESMKTFGIVQPLLVKDNGGHYTIIAGERRYRAARIAKLSEVPVIIKDYTEMEILQVALIENIQRQDLTSIEEANCYKKLMDDFFFSADQIAEKLGKNKHSVISSLHLLELSPRAQELAAEGKLTASHAKVLLSVEDADLQAICAEKIVEDGLSVRGAETMIATALKIAARQAAKAAEEEQKREEEADEEEENQAPQENASYAYRRAEYVLKQAIGSQVRIMPGKKISKIEIEYYSIDDLERILGIFKQMPRPEGRT